MRIINTFISETSDIPAYTKISLEQARRHNPSIPIDFISASPAEYFKELDINWVNQKDVEGDLLQEFRAVSWFDRHGTPNTSHPSPEGFWVKTAERLFYLEEYISQNKFSNVFHFENDVLLYGDISTINPNHAVLGINTSEFQTTFALANILDTEYYRHVCMAFIQFMKHGERALLNVGYDHISEMSLLNLANRNNIIGSFNIFPEPDNEWVFDPASYGQFLGGTNNEHGPGFIDRKHYIGQALMQNRISVSFNDGCPYVYDNEKDIERKLFNLHIHSKNLKDFV